MKKLLLIFLVFVSTSSWSACNKKIDQSKVMIFVDANDSSPEILTAERAACERGQKLIIIPKNYKEYIPYMTKITLAIKNSQNCFDKYPNGGDNICQAQSNNIIKVYEDYQKFQDAHPTYKNEMKEELEKLKKSHSSLENLMISGHDGGGHFGGSKQSFTKQEVAEVMAQYPEVNNVKSVMLLGCYTGVQKEVLDWENIFPDARLIAGYDGSAPLSDKPDGHEYLYDLLTKEKQLTSTGEQNKLKGILASEVKSLRNLNAAFYIKPTCGNNGTETAFYYGLISSSDQHARQLRPYDKNECLNAKKELEILKLRLDKYDSGELEVPKDTANGELRQIYNKARSFEHCSVIIGEIINANKVFSLLFYENEKKNFANFYDKEMQEAEGYIKGLDSKEIVKKAIETSLLQEAQLKAEQEDMNLYNQDPVAYTAKEKIDYENLKKNYLQKMQDPKYKSFLDKYPNLRNLDQSQVPVESISVDEQKLYKEFVDSHYAIATKKGFLTDPSSYMSRVKMGLEYRQNIFAQEKIRIKKYELDPSQIDKIWIPNKKNLETKSRKELLLNLHKINEVMSLSSVPVKTKGALSWIDSVSQRHLELFENPFEWHEYTGNTQAPSYPQKLSDTIKLANIYGNPLYR